MKNLTFNKNKIALGVSSVLPLFVAGCATTATPENLEELKSNNLNRNQIDMPRTQSVAVHDQPYVDNTPIAYRKGSENLVDVSASGSGLADALQAPATALGYSISFTSGVDPMINVNMHLRGVGALDAIKKIAQSVGYVAVVDEHSSTITIAEKATWVLRVPPSLFDGNSVDYDISKTSSESQTDEGSVGSGDNVSSSFSISGQMLSEEQSNFEEIVRRMLAEDPDDANASFAWNSGTISIEGDVFSLNRAKNFIDELVRNALTQVEVKTTIAQVRLTDEQRYGINWNNLLSSSSVSATIAGGAMDITNPAFSATTTRHSVETVINAVAENNSVSVMASPSILTKNNRPATIFNGSKIPYLGEVELATGDGVSTSGAEAMYASEGLSLSVIPSALDNNTISLKLIPSLTDIGEFRTFSFTNDEDGIRLEVPEVFQRQMYIDVTAQSGETIILGGTRTAGRDRGRSGVPGAINSTNVISKLFGGVNNSDYEEELVIMVRASVIPAPQFNSLVSQSL